MSCCGGDDIFTYRTLDRVVFGRCLSVGSMCYGSVVCTAGAGVCMSVNTLVAVYGSIVMRRGIAVCGVTDSTNCLCGAGSSTATMSRLFKLLTFTAYTLVPMVIRIG